MSKTYLTDLIEKVSADDLPTNEFTIEDTDPMVLLGKLNEIIANLTAIRDTIDASDTKALEALNNSIKALETANKAITGTIQAIETANTAIETANTSIETANSAKTESSKAITDSSNALSKAETADTNANKAITDSSNALSKAETADTNANKAITDSSNALSKAETADTNANKAITDSSNALSKAEDAYIKAEGAESYAINADANASSAIDIANEALSKVVAGLGTIIKDYNGNSLKEANFRGTDTINVDMKENDPNTFEFRLDNTIVTELTTATNNITSILADLTNVKTNISNINTDISNINTAMGNIWNLIYPVGSFIYNDNPAFDPNNYGGTWRKVTGRFLRGTNDINELGKTGGEDKHTLTIDEMPSHNHTQEAHRHGLQSANNYSGSTDGMGRGDRRQIGCMQNNNGGTQYYTTPQNVEGRPYYMTAEAPKINPTGKGVAFNILPTYQNVFIWYRVI